MTRRLAMLELSLALFILLFLVASMGRAADDPYPAGEASVSKAKKSGKRKQAASGITFGLDGMRAELGAYTGDPGPSADAYVNASASATSQSGAWEFALGARFDAYSQVGTPDYSRARLDYTENYLRWRAEDTRITLGTQNVLWGRVDEMSPIDRLSRVDLSRLVLDKLPDRRRAVPALRLEHFLADFKLDAVLLPVFDAAVLPHEKSSWYPVDTASGRMLGIGAVPAIAGARLEEDERGMGGGGVRITRTGGTLDYGFSLQRVRQSLPYYRVAPGLLTATHPYGWVVGGELETQQLGGTWRMEAAWNSNVPVTTNAYQYREERGVDLVLGMEYYPGDGETRINLQLAGHKTYTDQPILDRGEFYNLTGEIEHPFALGRWRANIRFVMGIDKRDLYLNPKLAYVGMDEHEIYLAAHLFSGAPETLGGYYQKSDLIVLGWQSKF